MGNTYTEEELQTAVAQATAELASKVAVLESAAKSNKKDDDDDDDGDDKKLVDARVEIELLKAKLDNAVLATQTVKAEFDSYQAELQELAATAELDAEIAARKGSRVEAAKALGFNDEYLTENADRFAAMSAEDWDSRLADWAVIGPAKGGVTEKIPAKTALTAAREDTATNSGMAAIREAMRGNLVGRDLRTL